ncbi:MAG: fasciclin domain-containing protein [Betaproteobacteria bacterium]|nr:fasciclin domain-containing protein [Betaproteobacteria bacterium]
MKRFIAAAVVAVSIATAQAQDIVDVAVGAGSFNTLVTAVKAAGLVDTLKGAGPFTVFAPTDEAFAKVPKETLDALLADKDRLTAVLTYHVVSGLVMSKDVSAGKVKTVQGSELTITTDGGVKVDDANVVKADIVTTNGSISTLNLFNIINNLYRFSPFV